jgi:glycosyltransferase involved in cell wall biosynthesis
MSSIAFANCNQCEQDHSPYRKQVRMGTYYAILTCRNSQNYIKESLTSLKEQTLTPKYVIVIDDGSSDKTPEILKKIQMEWTNNLYILTNPDLGYNIGRVVSNWNKAIKFAQQKNLEETDYHLICTYDAVFEKNYAEKVIVYMDSNPDIAIASGNFDENIYDAPHGAGRVIRNSFFIKNHRLYPEKMGYESLLLHTADRAGYTYTVLQHVRFKHTRDLGKNHNFYEFGASMQTLGYHPLFALGRCLIYFISGRPIGRIGAIHMLYYYLIYRPKKDGYDSMYEIDVRKYVRECQFRRVRKMIYDIGIKSLSKPSILSKRKAT